MATYFPLPNNVMTLKWSMNIREYVKKEEGWHGEL
jgi:hypothetical protein